MQPETFEVVAFPEDRRPAHWRHPIVAVGNFDGVHRGHQKILERVCRRAGERGGTAIALTFDPHPPRVVRPDKAPPLLMTPAQKLAALARAGLHGAAIVRFTRDVAAWDPDRFVRTVLVDWLGVAEVWVGGNFLFGRDRSGNFSLLRALGQQYGFRADKIDPVRYKEFVVSSTRIRRLVAEGRLDEAGALLGHPYVIAGVVVPGDGRGRRLQYPTANLATENELLPPNGVYATCFLADGRIRPAVTNVGRRPTFGGDERVGVETHVLDFDGDLYGRRADVAFLVRLRDERAFPDAASLQAQMATDVERARDLFRRISL